MLRDDFALTKRHLGLILLVLGGLATLGLLSIDPLAALLHRLGNDLLPADRQVGIGPRQALALAGSVLMMLAGLSLVPLGSGLAALLPVVSPVQLSGRWALARRILLGLVVAALLLYLAVYVYYAVNVIVFPFDYDQGEGFELVDTIMFSQFRWPYQDTETFPFYSSNYPPLFHVIAVPFVWLFGPAYWYGRLLGFLGTLITAAAIGYAVYRAERYRAIAVVSGLAYLASNYIYHVGPLFRQHLFMVMLEVLAVVVLAQVNDISDRSRRRRVLLAGMALLLAAGYTKQLAIATVGAVFLWLFITNPRRSLVWGAMFAAAAGAIFLLIDTMTGGQWWLNIITANVNPFVDGQFEGLFRQWFGLHGVLIVLAGLMVLYELYFDRISLYSIWFGAATINTLLAGKWGAGDSYFATAIAAVAILSGIFAARMLRGTWRFPENYLTRWLSPVGSWLTARRVAVVAVAGIVVPALYLLYAAAVFHWPTEGPVFREVSRALGIAPNTGFALYDSAGWTPGYAVIGQIPTTEDIDNGWRLVDIVAEGESPAISEDAAFSIHAGKQVIANPTQLRNLYNNGLYDPTEMITMIEDQAFHALVLRALFYPDPVLYAMGQAYAEEESIPMNGFYYHVFRPDPSWPARRDLRDQIYALDGDGGAVFGAIVPPVDGVESWLWITLGDVGWQQAGDWVDGVGIFTREGARLTVTVTPDPEADSVRVRVEMD